MLGRPYPVAGAHDFLIAILLRSGHYVPEGVIVFPGLCLQNFFFLLAALRNSPHPTATYGKYIVSILGSTD